jgi:hypothetical protein
MDSDDSISHFTSICCDYIDIVNDSNLNEAFLRSFGSISESIENSSDIQNIFAFLGIFAITGLKSEVYVGDDRKKFIAKKIFKILLRAIEGCSNAIVVSLYLVFFAFEFEFSLLLENLDEKSAYQEARVELIEAAILGLSDSNVDQLFQLLTHFFEFSQNLGLPNNVYKGVKGIETLTAPKDNCLESIVSFFIALSDCCFDCSSDFSTWHDLLQAIHQNTEAFSDSSDQTLPNNSSFTLQKKFKWGNVKVEFEDPEREESVDDDPETSEEFGDSEDPRACSEGEVVIIEDSFVNIDGVLQKVNIVQVCHVDISNVMDVSGPDGPEGILKSELEKHSSSDYKQMWSSAQALS